MTETPGAWQLYLLEHSRGPDGLRRVETTLGGRHTQVLARTHDSKGFPQEITFELGTDGGRDVLFIRCGSGRLAVMPYAGNLIRVTTGDLAREEDR